MLIWVWTRNDESGILDDEFRDGDVMQTKPDSFEPSIGLQEKKSWLIVRIPNPPNIEKVEQELVRSEYSQSATAGDDPVVRRKRIFSLNWRSKFTAEEIRLIEGDNILPDGPDVSNGIVTNKFNIKDFSRK